MEPNGLLESYLRLLRLPSFVRSYQSFATDAARNYPDNWPTLTSLPTLNKTQVLDLSRGEYIHKREPIVFIGNPGENPPCDSTGFICLSPGSQSPLLDRCWTGQ